MNRWVRVWPDSIPETANLLFIALFCTNGCLFTHYLDILSPKEMLVCRAVLSCGRVNWCSQSVFFSFVPCAVRSSATGWTKFCLQYKRHINFAWCTRKSSARLSFWCLPRTRCACALKSCEREYVDIECSTVSSTSTALYVEADDDLTDALRCTNSSRSRSAGVLDTLFILRNRNAQETNQNRPRKFFSFKHSFLFSFIPHEKFGKYRSKTVLSIYMQWTGRILYTLKSKKTEKKK